MTSTRFIIYGYNNGNKSQPWNDRLGSLANERVYPSFHILNATMFVIVRAIISRIFFEEFRSPFHRLVTRVVNTRFIFFFLKSNFRNYLFLSKNSIQRISFTFHENDHWVST